MDKKKFFLYIAFVVVLLGVGIYLLKTNKANVPLLSFNFPSLSSLDVTPTIPFATKSAEFAVVKRVIDGDTIELTDGRKVRYIGIDTPELHHPTKKVQCFAREAMEKNKELVEGKTIEMKKDVSNTDIYKRLLRYVWIPATNSAQIVFVNEYLVKEGYAYAATFPPDVANASLFQKAAASARVQNKGLWSSCK